jgi:hypothetical protein
MKRTAFAVALLSFALSARAQTATSPEARRDEIAKVQEMLADPDPLMRLTNMEAIVKSGDPLKLQAALRTAFASDDGDLRGLALRAYLATRKEITFEITLPVEALDAQRGAGWDRAATAEVMRRYTYLTPVIQQANRFQLAFPDYAFPQDRGTAQSSRRNGSFTIAGERLTTQVPVHNWGACYVDFAPTRKQTIEGTISCGHWPPLRIAAPAG